MDIRKSYSYNSSSRYIRYRYSLDTGRADTGCKAVIAGT